MASLVGPQRTQGAAQPGPGFSWVGKDAALMVTFRFGPRYRGATLAKAFLCSVRVFLFLPKTAV